MNIIAKTELTLELENKIWRFTSRQGLFGCFEVTMGFGGTERGDYVTYDTNGIWRCYEVKISKSDFHSKAKNTFVGHYNYYVMPRELYEQVKDEIPSHIGVVVGGNEIIKKSKKQELGIDEQILKDSMIRSLYRDVEKYIKNKDTNLINRLRRDVKKLEKEVKESERDLKDFSDAVREVVGYDKFREIKKVYQEK